MVIRHGSSHRIDFDESTLERLAFLGLSNRQISEHLGVHHSTLTRRGDVREFLGRVRAQRAAAIVREWLASPTGVLGPIVGLAELTDLASVADRRKIARKPA